MYTRPVLMAFEDRLCTQACLDGSGAVTLDGCDNGSGIDESGCNLVGGVATTADPTGDACRLTGSQAYARQDDGDGICYAGSVAGGAATACAITGGMPNSTACVSGGGAS